MRRILLMTLFSVASNAIAQGSATSDATTWIVVGRAHTFTVYANPATIQRAGSMVTVWEMKEYNTAQMYDGEPYMSQKTQNEYDCKEGQSRILALSLHSENMGGGKTVWSAPDPDEWHPVASIRLGEASRKFACGRK
jgi:hypothetical protein